MIALLLSLIPDSVRLVKGPNMCSGRLRVKSNLGWSTVCTEDFTQQSADVVCRELGCGTPSVFTGARVRVIEATPWKMKVQCGGYESVLQDCRSFPPQRKMCLFGKAVWISCSGRAVDLRHFLHFLVFQGGFTLFPCCPLAFVQILMK